ncbi:MAG: NAD(P)-binding protein, partial [Acidimicrobiales bacterium]
MEAKLSLPLDRLRERYEVVVVGSGYGGAIAASRLARTGRSVCVLERGRELRPG